MTLIRVSCRPGETARRYEAVTACVGDVELWMQSNRLQLNTANTEVVWHASARRQHRILEDPLMVGLDHVLPVRSVRDLGIYLDSDLLMRTHVIRIVSSCFWFYDRSAVSVAHRVAGKVTAELWKCDVGWP